MFVHKLLIKSPSS